VPSRSKYTNKPFSVFLSSLSTPLHSACKFMTHQSNVIFLPFKLNSSSHSLLLIFHSKFLTLKLILTFSLICLFASLLSINLKLDSFSFQLSEIYDPLVSCLLMSLLLQLLLQVILVSSLTPSFKCMIKFNLLTLLCRISSTVDTLVLPLKLFRHLSFTLKLTIHLSLPQHSLHTTDSQLCCLCCY